MTLTKRDTKLLDMIVKGAKSSEIATKLDYTEGTIRVYLHHLYRKIKVNNRTQAAVWWVKEKSNVAS